MAGRPACGLASGLKAGTPLWHDERALHPVTSRSDWAVLRQQSPFLGLLVAALLLLVLTGVDMLVGQSGKLSVLDFSHSGYAPEHGPRGRPPTRRRVQQLLLTIADPAYTPPEGRQRVVEENVAWLNYLSYELLWCSHRLLEDLGDRHLEAYDKILQVQLAFNGAYRAEWSWIEGQLDERLAPAALDPAPHTPAVPGDWIPSTDPCHDVWKRVYDRSSFRTDLMLQTPSKVLLVSLLSLTPPDLREMGPARVARLRGYARRLLNAASSVRRHWDLLQRTVFGQAREYAAEPPGDIGFEDLARTFREVEAWLRKSQSRRRPRRKVATCRKSRGAGRSPAEVGLD